ncbi:MAG: hypothetical protein LBR80_15175 [Deltaproteobacteria bacterium]|nr:hypothetical protein [Deltaproteobacteria bacterium]
MPADFSQWHLTDDRDIPVAHVAAEHGTLPTDFRDWEIRDRPGRTVAHIAVQQGPLPPHYDLWTLRDRCGFNVAETVCIHGNLPAGISDWRVLVETAATPRNLIRPNPLWPTLSDSGSAALDALLLTIICGISTGVARGEDFPILIGDFLDAFYLHGSETRNMMIRESPRDMAEHWQVPYLGATAAVLARRFDLEVPAWACRPRCFLTDAAPYSPFRMSRENILTAPASTPPEFRERNVFVSGSALYRV